MALAHLTTSSASDKVSASPSALPHSFSFVVTLIAFYLFHPFLVLASLLFSFAVSLSLSAATSQATNHRNVLATSLVYHASFFLSFPLSTPRSQATSLSPLRHASSRRDREAKTGSSVIQCSGWYRFFMIR